VSPQRFEILAAVSGSLIAENEIQDAAFEPFTRRIAAATGFAHPINW